MREFGLKKVFSAIRRFTGRDFIEISSLFLFTFCSSFSGCTLLATRPIQEMSFTSAAIRAAKEVQADTLSPEFFRQSNEWFFKAKHEYKFKNFKLAKDYAQKAKYFAEKAELDAIRGGGNRSDQVVPDPLGNNAQPPPPKEPDLQKTPYQYPTPQGTPVDVFDQRQADEEAKRKAQEEANRPVPSPQPQGGQNYLPPLPTPRGK